MRIPFRRHRPARQPRPSASAIVVLSVLAPALTYAISFDPAPPANLDLSNLGRIGIVGDFDGISLFQYEAQIGKPRSTNGSESLLTQLPNGALASIVDTDASIRAMCRIKLGDDDTDSVVIGGNFTSVDGTKSTAMALFNPNTTKITPLDGLQGEVNTVLCDQDRNSIYVGGIFKGANSTNAIVWDDEKKDWENLPFAGFNGPVEAITKSSNGHIIFGGSFTGLGNASAPREPDSQTINLSSANITGTNSASDKEFSDPRNVVCPGSVGRPWLAQDQSGASWDAEFGFGFEPTKLRLWNTHKDGRGTKTFRFYAFPINGIMNFTYTDPATGKNATCASECTLSDDPSIQFQDFHFVNRVGMNGFRLIISEWYNAGAGLEGVELFQDNIFAYAITDFNEPKCGGTELVSTATTTGPWQETPSRESNANYLTAKLKGNFTANSASVVFVPNIRESGNYSVDMYTPGCKPDATCDTRGRVNITGVMASTDDGEISTTLFQTNNFDKYDQIYFGFIEKTSDSFQPTVTLTPLAGQDVDELTIVAQRIGFTLTNTTGGLNGLFDFDPDQKVILADDFGNSAINKLGASFDKKSGVRSLATSDDVTYIAGNFTSSGFKNIVAISSKDKVKTLDGGLNGEVLNMHLEGDKLYIGGSFSNTLSNSQDGLNHVAIYNSKDNSFSTLGAGVDGPVEFIVPLQVDMGNGTTETLITLTGSFSECNKFDNFKSSPANGFAVWVPSQNNWLQNLDTSLPTFSGILTAAVVDPSSNISLYAGSISSAQLGATGAATLNDNGLGKFPAKIQSQQPSSKATRRDESSSIGQISGVSTGTFYEEGDSNITILAGHFSAQAKDGSTVNNVVFIDGKDGDNISGFGSEISADASFVTVALHNSVLFAGGKVSGTIRDNKVNGMVLYDMSKKDFADQPPSVNGGNGTVSAITVRPDTSEVYVAGSFLKAGALDCPGLCLYNADADQWVRPGDGLSGQVSCLMWSSKSELIVGGDLSANGTDRRYLAMYNAKSEMWQDFPDSNKIPGPVQVMTPASQDGQPLWISGTSTDGDSVYLMKYDGSKWLTATQKLEAKTVVRSLQVFSLTQGHADSDMLDNKQVLMLTGSIVIPNTGTVSAALYNGTHYEPYALTTNSQNDPGSIAKIFTQKDAFFSSGRRLMPLVFVVLIGLAISLGLILLLVVGGMVLDRLRKKREGYTPAPTSMYDRGSGIQRIPPRELLESLGKSRPGAAPHV